MDVGAPDPSLTGASGVLAVSELVERLGVVELLDAGVGPIKQRDRGVGGGQLLTVMAQSQLLGGDALVALDRQRADMAAAQLSGLPGIPSTTAASLAARFGPEQLGGIETGQALLLARALPLLPAARRGALLGEAPTIDMDSTDVEVYGRAKQGVAYNYAGQRAGRPHLASWAQAGITLAADLLAGNDDVRPRAAGLLRRALAVLPEQAKPDPAGQQRCTVRADAGYFTAELAQAAVESGCDFAIAAKRNPAMWRAYHGVCAQDWTDCEGMHGAQVAAAEYAPAGWPDGSYTVIRRVRVPLDELSPDGRSRRRRTIDPEQLAALQAELGTQLALTLDGDADGDCVYAVSFIVTNLPSSGRDELVALEQWFRRRTDIEDRIREAKLGAAMRRLPSGNPTVNTVWMWAALLAGNLSVLLQALTGLDQHGRMHAARLRHCLLLVPGRIIRHAGRITLRLPPGPQLLAEVLSKLRALPRLA